MFRVLAEHNRDALTDLRVYFGVIRFFSPFVMTNDGFELTFINGGSALHEKFRLFVRTVGWTPDQVATVMHELTLAKQKVAELERQRSKMSGHSKKKPLVQEETWVYFLGQPSPNDPLRYVIDHPFAICAFQGDRRHLGGDPDPEVPSRIERPTAEMPVPSIPSPTPPQRMEESTSSTPEIKTISSPQRSTPQAPARDVAVRFGEDQRPRTKWEALLDRVLGWFTRT